MTWASVSYSLDLWTSSPQFPHLYLNEGTNPDDLDMFKFSLE
jgi:hypothetical protein